MINNLKNSVMRILENPSDSGYDFDSMIAALYDVLAATYDGYKSFITDSSSSQYKLLSIFETIDDEDNVKAESFISLLYINKINKLVIEDLLEYLEATEFTSENVYYWLTINEYVQYGSFAKKFYNYLNGFSYGDQTILQYIVNTLFSDTGHRFVKKGSSDHKVNDFKIYPKIIEYSFRTNASGFRNYREVMEAYDSAMSDITLPNLTCNKNSRIQKEMEMMTNSLLSTGPMSDRSLLGTSELRTQIFFKNHDLDEMIKYVLLSRYYITIIADDIQKALDEFIIYFLNNLDRFNLDYSNIDFLDMKDYFLKYIEIQYSELSVSNLKTVAIFSSICAGLFNVSDNTKTHFNDIKDIYDQLDLYTTNIKSLISDLKDADVRFI